MNSQESLFQIQALIPSAIGGTLGLLALYGIRELFKETASAFKKQVRI